MKSREALIDDHYKAVVRELAVRHQFTPSMAIKYLLETGFKADFDRDPDAYLHIMPSDLATEVLRQNPPPLRADQANLPT